MGANIKVKSLSDALKEDEVTRISRNFFKTKDLDYKYFNSCDHGTYFAEGSAPVHVHENLEEIFYFLRGKGIFLLDSKEITVKAGSVITVPPKISHGIRNVGNDLLQHIVCSSVVNKS